MKEEGGRGREEEEGLGRYTIPASNIHNETNQEIVFFLNKGKISNEYKNQKSNNISGLEHIRQ